MGNLRSMRVAMRLSSLAIGGKWGTESFGVLPSQIQVWGDCFGDRRGSRLLERRKAGLPGLAAGSHAGQNGRVISPETEEGSADFGGGTDDLREGGFSFTQEQVRNPIIPPSGVTYRGA
jgi:hypothetical protein